MLYINLDVPTGLIIGLETGNGVLVPDDTLQKGTSKHQKTDEKRTHSAVRVYPSIFDFFEKN